MPMSSPAKRQATKGPPATPKKHKLGKPQIPLSEQSTDVSSSASYPTPPSSPVPPHSANPVPPSPIKKSTRKACPTQKLIESIEQTPKRKPDKNNPKIGDGRDDSLTMDINLQVENLAQQVAADPKLQQGFNMVLTSISLFEFLPLML